jgi:hypothetical protein
MKLYKRGEKNDNTHYRNQSIFVKIPVIILSFVSIEKSTFVIN